MDAEDEKQIAATMQNQVELLQVYVYQFTDRTGKVITSLSYEGIKEAIRHLGNTHIISHSVERDGDKFVGTVVVRHLSTNTDFIGIAEADANGKFGRVQAANKAERNAYKKLIPAHIIATMIAERLKTGEGVQMMSEADLPQQQPPPQTSRINQAKTVANYKLPPKKVEAIPIPKVGDVTSQGTVTNVESTTYHDGTTITRVDCEPPKKNTEIVSENPVTIVTTVTKPEAVTDVTNVTGKIETFSAKNTTSPQKIVPPLQVMINKEKEQQQAKKADELRKDNKVSNTSFAHTIPDSTGKLVPVTEEEYLAYCQMNQTTPASDSIIWEVTSGGKYEKAYEKTNKDKPEYQYIKDSLTEAKEQGKKGLTLEGTYYFLDTYKNDGFLRTLPAKSEGTP